MFIREIRVEIPDAVIVTGRVKHGGAKNGGRVSGGLALGAQLFRS